MRWKIHSERTRMKTRGPTYSAPTSNCLTADTSAIDSSAPHRAPRPSS